MRGLRRLGLIAVFVTSVWMVGGSGAVGAAGSASLRSVHWGGVSVPGTVCPGLTGSIALDNGQALRPTPAGLQSGTPDVVIQADTKRVVYGRLGGRPSVAALNVWCSNTGGTADGQLADSWVVFTRGAQGPRVLSLLSTQQPVDIQVDHVPYFNSLAHGIVIGHNAITVHELWYGLADDTCCPSGRATTVWAWHNGRLSVARTSVQREPHGPFPVKVVAATSARLNDVVGYGSAVAVDVKTEEVQISMTCGSAGSSKGWVQLKGIHLEVDTNLAHPTLGHMERWSAKKWVSFVVVHGWEGTVNFVQAPPRLTDDPTVSNCLTNDS